MAIDQESFNKKLYDLLKTRGYRPIPKDSKNERTESPQDADVFNFTFTKGGEEMGDAWVTIDDAQDVILYYDDDIMDTGGRSEGSEFDDSWSAFIQHLKRWAMSKQLGFELRDKNKLGDDMAQREYTRKKENISEGYYPMGKQSSYSDAVPTVKIILQHTRQIQEGEQRYRNIARIFLENQLGERILAPTTRPGVAQVYARHLAEGGVPNDERWNHIKGLCEEYTKMAGFVRATRGNQFNESAQQLVNEGINHYHNLRETLGRMRGHRGYHKYFESYTPTLMETEGDETNLTELFVQETLDPRIESVMPILSRLQKNVTEMKEVIELDEWAKNLIEGGDGGEASEETDGDTAGDAGEGGAEDNPPDNLSEAPGAETLAHNQDTEEKNLKAFGLAEFTDRNTKRELERRVVSIKDKLKDSGLSDDERKELELDLSTYNSKLKQFQSGVSGKGSGASTYSDPDATKLAKITDKSKQSHKSSITKMEKRLDDVNDMVHSWLNVREDTGLEEGMTKDAMMNDAEKMSLEQFCDKYGDEDWVKEFYHTAVGTEDDAELAEGILDKIKGAIGLGPQKGSERWVRMEIPAIEKPNQVKDKLIGLGLKSVEHDTSSSGPTNTFYAKTDISDNAYIRNEIRKLYSNSNPQKIFVGNSNGPSSQPTAQPASTAPARNTAPADQPATGPDLRVDRGRLPSGGQGTSNRPSSTGGRLAMPGEPKGVYAGDDRSSFRGDGSFRYESAEQDVEEGLDANQKRVGQLGPTEKVKNNNIGKLVGANESLELNEMDKSQPSSDRGGESSGNPYAKGGKATPAKAKDAEKDAEKVLNKSMDKAHKKDVKEGQEDLDAILRLLGK